MAGYFKPKRRRSAGPNKNEQKVMRGRSAENQARFAALLKDRFPNVQRLTVELNFFTPQEELYEQQTRAFDAQSKCDLAVPCLGRCGGRGSFDLAAKVKSVVDARQERSDGHGVCREPLYAGATDVCGFKLHAKIQVEYAD